MRFIQNFLEAKRKREINHAKSFKLKNSYLIQFYNILKIDLIYQIDILP